MNPKLQKWIIFAGSTLLASSAWAANNNIVNAKAILAPTQGNIAAGQVLFTQKSTGVKIVVDANGLTPGAHGWHVHEYGDCSAPDGQSAGTHFNPTHLPHGAPDNAPHHIGDFGNLNADADGKAHLELFIKGATLQPSTTSLVGRSIIIHAAADDLKSQPNGNSGARVACGVIGIIN